jgi:hypothetical protein
MLETKVVRKEYKRIEFTSTPIAYRSRFETATVDRTGIDILKMLFLLNSKNSVFPKINKKNPTIKISSGIDKNKIFNIMFNTLNLLNAN